MTDKTYIEMTVPVTGLDGDRLSGELHALGSLGVLEASESHWVAYFPGEWTPEHLQAAARRLGERFPELDGGALRIAEKPVEDWNAEWRRFFKPIRFAEGWWVRPPWERLPDGASGRELVVDPQMGFGTGNHETTRLVLQALAGTPPHGLTVLDVGTGSGILAIFARLLGAASCQGVDIEPEAIDNAVHNARLNGVEGVDFRTGDLSVADAGPFDLVLANIILPVLKPMAPELLVRTVPGGRLILSGLLHGDVVAAEAAYGDAGFVPVSRHDLNEWAALVMRRPGSPA